MLTTKQVRNVLNKYLRFQTDTWTDKVNYNDENDPLRSIKVYQYAVRDTEKLRQDLISHGMEPSHFSLTHGSSYTREPGIRIRCLKI